MPNSGNNEEFVVFIEEPSSINKSSEQNSNKQDKLPNVPQYDRKVRIGVCGCMQPPDRESFKICVVTLFPEFFDSPTRVSILKRAQDRGLLKFDFIQIRDFSTDKHHRVDDAPYGGSDGLVMQVEPLAGAINEAKKRYPKAKTILLTPQGKTFNQETAHDLYDNGAKELILVCGHYEGFDERVRSLVDDEISVGDFVVTGGEYGALLISDAVARLIPSVLGSEACFENDSFYNGLLEYPQYTRPQTFQGLQVPDVLTSGNHAEIEKWRREESLKRTLIRRPDLLREVWDSLTIQDHAFLKSVNEEKWQKLQISQKMLDFINV